MSNASSTICRHKTKNVQRTNRRRCLRTTRSSRKEKSLHTSYFHMLCRSTHRRRRHIGFCSSSCFEATSQKHPGDRRRLSHYESAIAGGKDSLPVPNLIRTYLKRSASSWVITSRTRRRCQATQRLCWTSERTLIPF